MSTTPRRATRGTAGLAAAGLLLGWLAAATPIATAGPIGPDDFRISDIGPDGSPGYEAQQQDAAYNPATDQFLVVWRGDEQGDLQAEIHGQLVDARTGATAGPNDFLVARIGPVGEDDTDAIEPAVAYNSARNEFVVVFAGDEATDAEPLITDTFEIYAQRVSASGTPQGPALRISDMGSSDTNGSFDANSPAITYNSSDDSFLVAWRGDDDSAGFGNGDVEIWGQRLAYSSGALVETGTNDFNISNMRGTPADTQRDARDGPAVAWNSVSNNFLVAWGGDGLGTDNEFEVFGQALSSAGAAIGADDFRISNTGSDGATTSEVFFDDLVYNASRNEFLAAWTADPAIDNDFEVHAKRLNGTSWAAVGGDTRLTTTGTEGVPGSPAQFAAVAHDPASDEYYLVWEAEGAGLGADEVEVFGARFTGALGAAEAAHRLTEAGAAGAVAEKPNTPDVVFSERAVGSFLLSWSGPDSPQIGAGDSEIFGQLLGPRVDLTAQLTASEASPAPGQPVTYTLSYANTGPDAVHEVVLTLPVPTQLNNVAFTATGVVVARPGPFFTWDLADLPAGATGQITVTGTIANGAANGDVITANAGITTTSVAVDSNPGNNGATAVMTVDAAPSVAIEQAAGQADPTASSPIEFIAQFSEPVTGLQASDVQLGGSATATPTSVTGGPSTYTVTVTATTDGTVTATIPAGAATDSDGNTSDPNTPSTSVDNTVTRDTTAPGVSLTTTATDPTAISPIPVTATFTEDVTGFDATDLNITNGSSSSVSGGPQVFTFEVTPTAEGLVAVEVPTGAAADSAGNQSTAATMLSLQFGTPPGPTPVPTPAPTLTAPGPSVSASPSSPATSAPAVLPSPTTSSVAPSPEPGPVQSTGTPVGVPPETATVAARIQFKFKSTKLTRAAKRQLRALAAAVPAGATVTTTSDGVVRAKGATKADRKRALKRARVVAAYLKAVGLPGPITELNQARTTSNRAGARRVEVRITYSQQ